VTGGVALLSYLWAWTGSPFATAIAQRDGWHEHSDPLAVIHLATKLASQISFTHFNHPTINLNLVVGFVGVFVLIGGLILMAIAGIRRVSAAAWVWTLGIGFLSMTSEFTPPNPRLLITAFPAVIVYAHVLKRRGFIFLIAGNLVFLAVLSWLTFVGITLRP
jgi:hypothetical protein